MLMATPRGAIYRIRPGVKLDSYGDPVAADWVNAERVQLVGAVVQSPSTTEDPDGLLAGHRNLFAPGVLDLKAEDLVEDADGNCWRVLGNPRIRHGLAMGTFTMAKLERSERRLPNG